MAAGMILFFDALEEYRELTDEQFGRLIRAGLIYGATGNDSELPAPEKYLYPGLRLRIGRDQEKYRDTCEKRAEAARKRWETQRDAETDGMQMDANGSQYKDKYQYKEKDKDKYQYKDKAKLSAQQYQQRDYADEDEEAGRRMIEEAGKERPNERKEKGNRRRE